MSIILNIESFNLNINQRVRIKKALPYALRAL